MFEVFLHSETWISLLILTFLEVVLGIDNIIFISIAANKVEQKIRKKAVNLGLVTAMILRIILLLGISVLIAMQAPFWSFHSSNLSFGLTGQGLILILGGLFLIYKSTSEIHHKIEGDESQKEAKIEKKRHVSFTNAIIQISLINLVFSIDSILTAVGMTNGMPGAMVIMVTSVVISALVMLLFANQVTIFVNKHPTVQMLGLTFLILIGFMLILEGGHLSDLMILGKEIGSIPKGYLYFAIAFSFAVELLNIRTRKVISE